MLRFVFILLCLLAYNSFAITENDGKKYYKLDSADSAKNTGNYILTLKLLENALIQSSIHHDSLNIYKINQRLGNLFYEWNDFDKTYYYYKEAQKVANLLNDDNLIAGAYNNLGTVFSTQQLWDSSLLYYKKSQKIYLKQEDTLSIAGTNNNIGTIYHHKKRYKESIKFYKDAFYLMQKMMSYDNAAVFALNISVGYKSLLQKDSALHYLQKAEKISKRLNLIKLNMRIANSYALLYQVFKDYKSANEYFNQYYTLKDSLYNLQKHEQIIEWQKRYESEKQQNTIDLLQKQNEIDAVNLRKQNIVIYSISSAALLALVILFMIIRQNKLKTKVLESKQINLTIEQEKLISTQKLQETKNQLLLDKIHHKERELVSSTMHILQKNELIQKLKIELDVINKTLDNDSLNKFSREMKGLSTQSGMWDNFSYHFEQVHPHFFIALKKLFPQLTQNDLKIAAFIKIGLNNKEIASLMQIAPDSIKSSKKRLKKKLHLSPQEDLAKFIMLNT